MRFDIDSAAVTGVPSYRITKKNIQHMRKFRFKKSSAFMHAWKKLARKYKRRNNNRHGTHGIQRLWTRRQLVNRSRCGIQDDGQSNQFCWRELETNASTDSTRLFSGSGAPLSDGCHTHCSTCPYESRHQSSNTTASYADIIDPELAPLDTCREPPHLASSDNSTHEAPYESDNVDGEQEVSCHGELSGAGVEVGLDAENDTAIAASGSSVTKHELRPARPDDVPFAGRSLMAVMKTTDCAFLHMKKCKPDAGNIVVCTAVINRFYTCDYSDIRRVLLIGAEGKPLAFARGDDEEKVFTLLRQGFEVYVFLTWVGSTMRGDSWGNKVKYWYGDCSWIRVGRGTSVENVE
ncbi:hypothetical protein BJ508DRAFT_380378 [Ascobolus immersus RN42]|uniref:Uncharacterized protein n=1 Tax=Ascobolus immersus RN42 TaxID=1160509 RepID=A0A3N4HYS6_ASCIM|nr:hypothetical protein BJ508DRAFT_380378 [Ascobolus immersus RN42]